jgi:aminoglycoside phosphotransferase (APT) family kinase protein
MIAAHVAEWDSAHVELAVYGTDDAQAIARVLEAFCRDTLGAPIARPLFHQSSIGAVTGIELTDGRRVVVKGHQPTRSIELLREIARIQRHVAARGLPAPAVIAGPLPLGHGHALVETFAEGALADAHEPEVRTALAEGLWAIVDACAELAAGSTLPIEALPEGLWPTPHSKLFDFDATAHGASFIDEVARAARAAIEEAKAAGGVVIGHADWRVEHVLFDGTRPVAAFDWDSLQKRSEPSLVGAVAHGFCADWTRNEVVAPAPTLDEARAFVAAYEAARGRSFDVRERRHLAGSFAYACAYTARCSNALGEDQRELAGTFMHLVAHEGLRLLAL